MQLLKIIPILVLLGSLSCTPGGPLSPKDAAEQLSQAFLQQDVKSLKGLLSKESLKKVETMAAALKNLEEKQSGNTANYYGLKPEALRNMDAETFLALYLRNESKRTLGKILKTEIIDIKRDKKKATVFFKAGAALIFVREGPYWKFDLTEL